MTVQESQIVRAIRGFKAQIRSAEGEELHLLATRYLDVERAIADNIAALSEQVNALWEAGEEPTWSQIYRLERFQRLEAQLISELARFNGWAASLIKDHQWRLGLQALDNAVSVLEMGRPGLGMTVRLPNDAIQGMVGAAKDGTPLGTLLASSYPQARAAIAKELIRSVALGKNPRVTAAAIRKATGLPLDRAMTIARTEQMRVYNESSMAAYRQAGVTKVQRLSSLDDRVCFPAGTKVVTQHGERPIEDVRMGDAVLTGRNRWRRVTETMRRQYAGVMTSLTLRDGRQLRCTADHPILVDRDGELHWVPASSVKDGETVFRCCDGGPQCVEHHVSDGSVERRISDAHDAVPALNQAECLAAVGVRALVPVDAIDLKGDVHVRQVEVNREAVDAGLLNELDAEYAQAATNVRLGFRLASVAAVARWATELLMRQRRDDAKVLPAVQAGIDDRRAAADLRAVAPIAVWSGTKALAASLAGDVARVLRPALAAAIVISVRHARSHAKRLAARLACLGDELGRIVSLIASLATESAWRVRVVPELTPAVIAGSHGAFALHHSHTGAATAQPSRLIGCGHRRGLENVGPLAREGLAADGAVHLDHARKHIHTGIVTNASDGLDALTVFNLEVDEDHTYFANGVLVHNCLACALADGEILSSEAEFSDHVCGRCTVVPLVDSVENPQWETGPTWFERQPDSVKLNMMGPGRFDAYKSGTPLSEFVTHAHDPVWGDSLMPTPVSALQ